jgi:hypothetical protein
VSHKAVPGSGTATQAVSEQYYCLWQAIFISRIHTSSR